MARDDLEWQHVLAIAKRLTRDYQDAVFIGGVAVFAHATKLGVKFQEASDDADLYLSLVGKAALRDRYEVLRNPNLGKDSALIEGEDVDLYVERQHPLAVPYDAVASFAEVIAGIRVAALEHLLVLKLDAVRERMGTGKGEKDVRDIARIVALLSEPRKALLDRFLTPERTTTLRKIGARRDIAGTLGLDAREARRFQKTLDANLKVLLKKASHGARR